LELNLTDGPKAGEGENNSHSRTGTGAVRPLVTTFGYVLWGTLVQLRPTARGFAKSEHVTHNVKHGTKLVGKHWAQGFLRRNRELRVTKPEPAAFIGILTFNKIKATRIYNNSVAVFGLNHFFSDD
jgi:hypothetical protein